MSPDWVRILLIALSGILNAVGFFGLFLVFFPGLTVSWLGHLIWVIYVGFNRGHTPLQFGLTIAFFVVNTVLMLVGSVTDNLLGAKKRPQGWGALVGDHCELVGHADWRYLPDPHRRDCGRAGAALHP
jgi:hypothetical protein